MLSLLSKKYSSNNVSLYRDDGLSVFKNISGQQAERHKTSFTKRPKISLYQQKHLPLKRKLLSKKHPVYSHNEV